ncbi:restriction endonuclease subunit S [Ectothiorhodospira marina]
MKGESTAVRDASARYAPQVDIPAVQEGYKQTEVGVIPEEWELVTVGDLATVRDGTHQTPKYVPIGIPFYSVEHVTSRNFSNTKFIAEEEHKHLTRSFKIERGDVLMTRIGSIGECVLVDWDVEASFYVSLALLKISGADAAYVVAYSESSAFKKEVDLQSLPSATPKKINLGPISHIRLALPKSQEEQRAIATALSDVDALLEALDRLIAKKRDIKQATMQQLLTGQTRLPGFEGAWEVKQFDEVLVRLNAKSNQIQTNDYRHTGMYPVVDQGKEPVVGFSDRANQIFHCPKGGVIVFGDHTCIVKFVDFDFLVGADGTQIIKGKPGQITLFYAYQLEYRGVDPTGYNRHFKSLREKEFSAPDEREQAAILSDMDAELEALQQRRAKTTALKQAMMQELLTGRTRLVEPAARERAAS